MMGLGSQRTGVTRNSGLYERSTKNESKINTSWKQMTQNLSYATP